MVSGSEQKQIFTFIIAKKKGLTIHVHVLVITAIHSSIILLLLPTVCALKLLIGGVLKASMKIQKFQI
jgi:hypothetical protein